MYEWSEAGQIPPEIYQEAAKMGIIGALAYDPFANEFPANESI